LNLAQTGTRSAGRLHGISLPMGKTISLLSLNVHLIDDKYRPVGNVISEPVYVAYPFRIPLYTAVHTVSPSPKPNLFI
jgi:hypothetical protein